ncbi:MAG: serine/threonine-protein kinase [Gemmataceae bacterium]
MSDSTLTPRQNAEPVWVFGRPSHLPAKLGRYTLERVLGEGGMGAVYLAHDSQLDRRVALKLPDLSNADRPQVDRFLREAKVAATLHHPCLCPLYDAGVIDGHYFLTMPVLEGRPLSAYLGQPMPPHSAVRIARKIAKALQSAHDSGIVHRDLKPSNVMMTGPDSLMVMDFGLALHTEAVESKPLTREGHVVGTPAYMAPEQVRGFADKIGPRTDIYALGVILYEMLAGVPPFRGTFTGLVVQIAHEPPPPLSDINPAVDADLAEVVMIALAKRPEERYASMRAFGNALRNATAGTGTGSGESPIAPDLPAPPTTGETRSLRAPDATPGSGVEVAHESVISDEIEVVERPRPKPVRRTFRRRRSADAEWALGFLIKVGVVVAAGVVLFFGGRFLFDFIEAQNVESALRTLREKSADAKPLDRLRAFADGNRTTGWQVHRDAGLYLCADANDWPRGLKLLERSADPTLREAARRDLTEPLSTIDILACADGWYEAAQRESGNVKAKLLARARDWYERLTGRLAGAEWDRVQNRIAEAPPKP